MRGGAPLCVLLGSLMTEQWREIPGYEGRYEVSDQGRVRSMDRVVVASNGVVRHLPGRMLKQYKQRYWLVSLAATADHPPRNPRVHVLVLAAFVGPRPEGQMGRHLDDDTDNNALPNLAWGTNSDNMLDAVRNGTHREARKTHCIRGHEFDGVRGGNRTCSKCRRITENAARARRRGVVGQEGEKR